MDPSLETHDIVSEHGPQSFLERENSQTEH